MLITTSVPRNRFKRSQYNDYFAHFRAKFSFLIDSKKAIHRLHFLLFFFFILFYFYFPPLSSNVKVVNNISTAVAATATAALELLIPCLGSATIFEYESHSKNQKKYIYAVAIFMVMVRRPCRF